MSSSLAAEKGIPQGSWTLSAPPYDDLVINGNRLSWGFCKNVPIALVTREGDFYIIRNSDNQPCQIMSKPFRVIGLQRLSQRDHDWVATFYGSVESAGKDAWEIRVGFFKSP